MKKVLVIDLNAELDALAKVVVNFLNGKRLEAQAIRELPAPDVAKVFNVFVFLTRNNSDKANVLEGQYPAKVTIVLSEDVKWEDEDGSVIPISKQDSQFLEKLLICIFENGSEDLKRGDNFSFPRGRDYGDGYGVVIGDGLAVILFQGGKSWFAEKRPVPNKAKKITSDRMPDSVKLAIEMANILI